MARGDTNVEVKGPRVSAAFDASGRREWHSMAHARYGDSLDGVIVGLPDTSSGDTHGAVWSNGTIADLGTLAGGGLFSDAEGINNQGVVAGVVARRTASPSTPSSGR